MIYLFFFPRERKRQLDNNNHDKASTFSSTVSIELSSHNSRISIENFVSQ